MLDLMRKTWQSRSHKEVPLRRRVVFSTRKDAPVASDLFMQCSSLHIPKSRGQDLAQCLDTYIAYLLLHSYTHSIIYPAIILS